MRLEGLDLQFRYPKSPRTVLSGVSLTLEGGQRLGILAPSGRGKTTLCKLLAGYETPDGGSVLLDGRPLASYPGPCPVQLVWQHPEEAVDPLMTLGDTLKEGGAIAPRILEGLGIRAEWCTRYPAELSGGELQRFCVARALGPGTAFLLADEMTAMLDAVSQASLWAFVLEECRRREIGLLAVSHDRALLDRVCDRVILPD